MTATLYPFNPNFGQEVQGSEGGIKEDMGFVYHLHRTTAQAVVGDIDAVHAAITLLSTVQTITTAITNPPCPRTLSITGTMAGGSLTGNVVITGTDAGDNVITDTIALNDNATVAGVCAFKTVTSIALPVRVTAADTVKIGYTEALGIGAKLTHNTNFRTFHNNTLEGTAATVVCDATYMYKNTIDLNTALNGSVVDAYFIV